MAESDKEAEYKQEFIERVRHARIDAALKQWQVAKNLGIPQDHYKHYEVLKDGKGRIMPHHLLAQFCLVCRVNLEWLIAGTGKKAWQPLTVTSSTSEAAPKRRRTRAKKAA